MRPRRRQSMRHDGILARLSLLIHAKEPTDHPVPLIHDMGLYMSLDELSHTVKLMNSHGDCQKAVTVAFCPGGVGSMFLTTARMNTRIRPVGASTASYVL